MQLLQQRIRLAPRVPARPRPALPVLMLGHAPGRVRVDRIPPEALAQMRDAGLGALLAERLRPEAPADAALCQLPLPLHSVGEFDDIFPDARATAAAYRSRLAGGRAWLPQAVSDFFANGGERLWLVRVAEADGQQGFLPSSPIRPQDLTTLRGLALALALPEVGLAVLPDLERLQIPAELPDIPDVSVAAPEPRFLPCGSAVGADQRERDDGDELPEVPPPLPTGDVLRLLQSVLARFRPDMQCLFTLPPAYSSRSAAPVIDPAALAAVEDIRAGADGAELRRLQLLFPYLRGREHRLVSAVGALAGLQAGSARRRGIWRSVAGVPLQADGLPYPPVNLRTRLELREAPGIGVLHSREGRVVLDDERLAVPALHPGHYAGRPAELIGFDGYRSAEVSRFIGFLQRQLRALGEVLVFNLDHRDPRPRLLLEDLLRRLHGQGALRGRRPEDAFSIRQIDTQEGTIGYEIEVAPAFPIDAIRLAFVNRAGEWRAEAAHE